MIGWAVKGPNGLELETAGPTRRSALVNWLVAGDSNPARMMLFENDSDASIEHYWRARADIARAMVVQVNITEVEK